MKKKHIYIYIIEELKEQVVGEESYITYIMASTEPTSSTEGKKNEETTLKSKLPKDYKKVAQLMAGKQGICSSSEGVKLKSAKCGVKRVQYVTGPRIVDWIYDNAESLKKIGVIINTSKDACSLVEGLLRGNFLRRANHNKDAGRGVLEPVRPKTNQCPIADLKDKKAFFIFEFQGSQSLRNMLSAGVVVVCFALTLFPVWPRLLKVAIWYLSVTFLILLTGFIFIRMLIWLVFWLLGFEAWFFPNIFDDELSVSDSFKPIFSFERAEPGQMQIRLATIGVIVGLGYIVANQPTSFDTYIHESKKFTFDLYEGKFLSDMSQQDKDNIDVPKFDTLEDILGLTDEAEEKENEFGNEQAGDDLINQILQDEAEEEEQLEKEREDEYRESKKQNKKKKKEEREKKAEQQENADATAASENSSEEDEDDNKKKDL